MAFLTIAGGSAWLGAGGSVRDLTVSRSRIVVPLKTHLPLTSRLGLLILNQVGQKSNPFSSDSFGSSWKSYQLGLGESVIGS